MFPVSQNRMSEIFIRTVNKLIHMNLIKHNSSSSEMRHYRWIYHHAQEFQLSINRNNIAVYINYVTI